MNEHPKTAAAQGEPCPAILRLPRAPLPPGQTARTYFEQQCRDGLVARYGAQPDLTAAAQLEDEISVIAELQLENYFLIVAEYVNFAKAHGVAVGPGRGSSPGSLVCYCLGISELDPLRHGLLFARFLNRERTQLLPDLGIDVPCGAYTIMRRHLAEIYGEDCVFNCAFYPQAQAGRAARNPVVHRDGLFICNQNDAAELPFTDIGGERVCSYTRCELERLGYIKFNFFGLKHLSRVQHCLATIAAESGQNVDLQTIDYADPKVFSLLSGGDTGQIFPFASELMADFLRQFKPDCLADLSLAFALDRPATVELMPEVIRRKQQQNWQSDDAGLDALLADSYGLILYQEQVMEIVHLYCGFGYEQADMLRRTLHKPSSWQQVMEDLLHDATARDDAAGEACAAELLQRLRQADLAGYPFMKSHAAGYATLGFRIAWLKCYYPRQYADACRCCGEEEML